MDAQSETERYDICIVGTALAESILSGALSRAGKTVLQIDEENRYGDCGCVLGWDELGEWTDKSCLGIDQSPAWPFGKATVTKLCVEKLQSPNRYMIDTLPKLFHASSSLIDLLVRSKVSFYLDFKPLDATYLYDESFGTEFVKVPSSREDIFTSKAWDLITKRKMMKLLKFAMDYDTVDASLVWKDQASKSFLKFLQDEPFSLSEQLANLAVYGLAFADNQECAVKEGLVEIHRKIKSYGRYGPFSYLFPMYGGVGEFAQAFCRTSAVHGATFMLGTYVKTIARASDLSQSIELSQGGDTVHKVECERTVNIDRQSLKTRREVAVTHRTILLTGSIQKIDDKAHNSLLLIYKTADGYSVQSIVHGAGLGVCPVGQVICYLRIRREGREADVALDLASEKICKLLGQDADPVMLDFHYVHYGVAMQPNDENSKTIAMDPDSTALVIEDVVERVHDVFATLHDDRDRFYIDSACEAVSEEEAVWEGDAA